MKTSELSNSALDWAVAKADNNLFPAGDVRLIDGGVITISAGGHEKADHWHRYSPSIDWALAGPIIERELIAIGFDDEFGWIGIDMDGFYFMGATPLEAALRCYVVSKLGAEIDIPEKLA